MFAGCRGKSSDSQMKVSLSVLAMTVIRLGLMRDLRKICHVFSRVMPRSTGALAAARPRLAVR